MDFQKVSKDVTRINSTTSGEVEGMESLSMSQPVLSQMRPLESIYKSSQTLKNWSFWGHFAIN